jgi:hypothetical protein
MLLQLLRQLTNNTVLAVTAHHPWGKMLEDVASIVSPSLDQSTILISMKVRSYLPSHNIMHDDQCHRPRITQWYQCTVTVQHVAHGVKRPNKKTDRAQPSASCVGANGKKRSCTDSCIYTHNLLRMYGIATSNVRCCTCSLVYAWLLLHAAVGTANSVDPSITPATARHKHTGSFPH